MKKKFRQNNLFSIDNLLLLTSALLLYLFIITESLFEVSVGYRIFLAVILSLGFFVSGWLHVRRTKDLRFFRSIQIFLFVLYLYLLVNVTLMDNSLGRIHRTDRAEYLEWFVNFRPFAFVDTYIKGAVRGQISFKYAFLNIFGNLVAFAPLSFFLPLLFPAERKWYYFAPTVLLTVAAVEGLQFLFMSGSCDVDDVILNVIGAVAIFFLFKIPPIRRFIRNITKSEY